MIEYMEEHYIEDPCSECSRVEYCDGWEAQFCCKRCMWEWGDDPPCDDCDSMDI